MGNGQLTNGQFATGFYVIEISTKDKNGEEVKDVKYIELYDEKNNQLTIRNIYGPKAAKPIEPGEKTTVKLGTSADNLFVVQQLDKESGVSESATESTIVLLNLNNEKKTFDFSATEADRGGYGVGWLFVKHNRVYQYNQTITVPWTNKDLTIEYATYRDKTLPAVKKNGN